MATSISRTVSSETALGGGLYAPSRRGAAPVEDGPKAPSTIVQLQDPVEEVEIFLIGIREPYRSVLGRLMTLIAPFQEMAKPTKLPNVGTKSLYGRKGESRGPQKSLLKTRVR